MGLTNISDAPLSVKELNAAVDELWNSEWCSMRPRFLIVSESGYRALMRMKYPPLPRARTTNMRRLRKLKYRRRP